jgi:NAD+-dependent farnesol dehydrogenase
VTVQSDGPLVFVTGGTGFIGRRLVGALIGRGHRVRCLVRSEARGAPLAGLGAELLPGDVSDAAALERGMTGATLAYHLAAIYDVGRVDVAAMELANVRGTELFLRALRTCGVARGVYVSSIVALGPADEAGGGDLSGYRGPYPTHYHRTKAEAHRLAAEAQRAGLPLVIACPAYVYGPGDEGPAAEYMRNLLQHRIPGLSTRPTHYSYVHVDDVVTGLVAAGAEGRTDATYVLGGEEATVNEFSRLVTKQAGTWLSPVRLPPVLVKLTGVLLDGVSRLTGRRMPISRELAESGATGSRWVHSDALARAELGYSPRSLAEGLPETVRDVQERLSR